MRIIIPTPNLASKQNRQPVTRIEVERLKAILDAKRAEKRAANTLLVMVVVAISILIGCLIASSL